MPLPSLDPTVTVFDTGISIKFTKSLRVASILNASYQLYQNDATPVMSSFSPIDLAGDYNSIARTLDLHFASTLVSNASYNVRIAGLTDPSGNPIPSPSGIYDLPFTTNATPVIVDPPVPEPVYVADHSIRTDAFTSLDTIIATNPNFYVVTTDPDLSSPIIDKAYNNGRVTIVFSAMISHSFLTSTYFKVQTKLIERGRARWANVLNVNISADTSVPSVYLDFPSIDTEVPTGAPLGATPVLDNPPVYNTAGHDYFLVGYKYRIKLDKSISGSPGTGATVVPSAGYSQTFVYVQSAPMSTWVIRHLMNKYPSVEVVDSLGNVVSGAIQYIDLDIITITFSVPFAGAAYLN